MKEIYIYYHINRSNTFVLATGCSQNESAAPFYSSITTIYKSGAFILATRMKVLLLFIFVFLLNINPLHHILNDLCSHNKISVLAKALIHWFLPFYTYKSKSILHVRSTRVIQQLMMEGTPIVWVLLIHSAGLSSFPFYFVRTLIKAGASPYPNRSPAQRKIRLQRESQHIKFFSFKIVVIKCHVLI